MKPVIGIIPSISKDERTYHLQLSHGAAIMQAGGLPILLAYVQEGIEQVLRRIDGLYLTGGYDVDPFYYGEAPREALGIVEPMRDAFEFDLVAKAMEAGKAILGVCRGCQVMNVALGGSLYQDIPTQVQGDILQHRQERPLSYPSHSVDLQPNSFLQRVLKKEQIWVNSYHHQAIQALAPGLGLAASSQDGIVEAIESTSSPFFLGVQWHPERLLEKGDPDSLTLYRAFIQGAIAASKTK